MNGILTDVRYALRTFRRSPAFYSLVVIILALGIASSVSIFSLVDGLLARPLSYRDPRKLVTLTSYAAKPPFDSNGSLSYNDFLQLQAKPKAESQFTFTSWNRLESPLGQLTFSTAAFPSDLRQQIGRASSDVRTSVPFRRCPKRT